MKNLLTSCAMLAAMLTAVPALQAGDLSDAMLAELGLAGMERLSDAEGHQIRGQGGIICKDFVPRPMPETQPFPEGTPQPVKPGPKPGKQPPKHGSGPGHTGTTNTINVGVNVNNHVEVSNVNRNLNVNVLQNHNTVGLNNTTTNAANAAATARFGNGMGL